MDTVEFKKSHLVAAYLVATAFFMGGTAAVGSYACPGDHGWRHVGMSLFSGLVWPIVLVASTLGYTAHNTKCLDGSAFIEPPHA